MRFGRYHKGRAFTTRSLRGAQTSRSIPNAQALRLINNFAFLRNQESTIREINNTSK